MKPESWSFVKVAQEIQLSLTNPVMHLCKCNCVTYLIKMTLPICVTMPNLVILDKTTPANSCLTLGCPLQYFQSWYVPLPQRGEGASLTLCRISKHSSTPLQTLKTYC